MHDLIISLKAWDVSLFQAINGHHSAFFDVFFSIITYFGNGWILYPLLIVLIVWRFYKKHLASVIIFSIIAISLSGIMNTIIKKTVDRERPLTYFSLQHINNESTFHVQVVGDSLRHHSFPSGHSNTAFSAAALLTVLFGGWAWAGYALALLVAYSRVYLGAHFPLDCTGGALLGIMLVYVCWVAYLLINPRSIPFHQKKSSALAKRKDKTGIV
jgi:membrane-associated phospholipid phosphatase